VDNIKKLNNINSSKAVHNSVHSVLKKWTVMEGSGKMSLAERLKNSVSEKEIQKNYRVAKVFQEALFGEPEAVEEVEMPEPLADPRPDLKEDSALWDRFLKFANMEDENLAGTLHGFRCMGTRIKIGRNGYVLRPDVDPSGDKAWETKEQYEEARDKWLRPHARKIAKLLQKLPKKA